MRELIAGSRPLSIRRRLGARAALGAFAAIFLALSLAFAFHATSLRRERLQRKRELAAGLASQLASGLDRDVPSWADSALQSMEAHPAVEFAALYSRSGELVASFFRDRAGDAKPPPRMPLETAPGGSQGSGNLFQLPVKHYGSQVGMLLLRVDLAAEDRAAARSAWVFAGLLLLAGLSAYPIGLRLMGSIAASIEKLDEGMKQASAPTGDEPPARETGVDELDALVARFDSFRRRLEALESELLRQRGHLGKLVAERTKQLSRNNSELENMVRQLSAAKVKAESASVAKSRFLANISHEIRTPMNGVLGMTELLLRSPLNDQQRRIAETVRRSGESLLAIINDVLDISRIEAGKLELQSVEFDVNETVEDVVDCLAQRAHAKGLEISCLVQDELPRLLGDPQGVRQVVTNLVSNAIKFTDRGEVQVRTRSVVEEPSSILVGIEVRDTGIGISPESATSLFEVFAQGDSSTTRRHEGTGLGLAISKQVAALMGGNIDLESQVGSGTCFRFTARFKRAEPGVEPEPLPAFPNLRVLVVDTNASSGAAIQRQCARLGLAAEVVNATEPALARLREATRSGRPFDLGLLDLGKSGLDGLALARAIREDANIGAIRLVLLVTLDQSAILATGNENLGLSNLTKPLQLRSLVRLLLDAATEQDEAARAGKEEPNAALPVGTRVLLAEDSPVNQQVASGMLVAFGCQVRVVDNGQRALEVLEEEPCDLVLMDCMMPVLDGFEATAEVRRRERADPGRPRAYIVAVTASAMTGDRERCLKAGMDDFVAKPYSSEDLRAALVRGIVAARTDERQSGANSPQPGPERLAAIDDCLDAGVLASLESLQPPGKPSLLGQVIGLYLKHGPLLVEEARSALAAEDVPTLRRTVHTLKSSSANVGAKHLSSLCGELEQQLREGWPDDAGRRFSQIESEVAKVCSALLNVSPPAVA